MAKAKPTPGTPFPIPSFPPPSRETQHTAHGTAKVHKPERKSDAKRNP